MRIEALKGNNYQRRQYKYEGKDMNDFSTRRQQAIEACEKAINGIEDNVISASTALLLCKKIARLVNDEDGIKWLEYEYGGYPVTDKGFITSEAWEVAVAHGRMYKQLSKKDSNKYEKYMFAELCGELEEGIISAKSSLKNYSTSGFSPSGNYALLATDRMTVRVSQGTNDLLKRIKVYERNLSILRSQYYDYAVKWLIELNFGKVAKTIFDEYQEKIDSHYSTLPTYTIQKLNAIEDMMEDGNPEHYAQVLTSCRRLWSDVAKQLFSEVFPDYTSKTFKTASGKEIDITGDHDNNKLSAVIETLQSKAAKNTLIGSETIYLVDWMMQISDRQNAGVHSTVSREQAAQCIIHTYIALGDILSLRSEVDSLSSEDAQKEIEQFEIV